MPPRRMASASSWLIAFWFPVANAVAIVPDGPGRRRRMCWSRRLRSDSIREPSACRITCNGPNDRPDAPRPANQKSRAKSWLPGTVIGGGGISRAFSWTTAPLLRTPGMSSCLTLTLSSGGSEDWIGAKVSRTEPFATNGSTARTFAWNAAIVGRARRGEATWLDRSQMTALLDVDHEFQIPPMNPELFALSAQAELQIPAHALSRGVRAIPIPTEWPNARPEPIPTTWANLNLLPIAGSNSATAHAK